MRRIVKSILILAAAAVLVFVTLLLYEFRAVETQRGLHVARVDWLPPEATDVTYAKTEGFGWITCYECSLPKDAFERLARKEEWKLEPKNNVTSSLRHELSPVSDEKIVVPKGVVTVDLARASGQSDSVANALVYEKRHPNGGGITVIYDVDASRLFVHESHR